MDRSSKIELTNMCLIYDEKRVLVQEKLGLKEKYKGGLVFPGGHVESGESLLDSVIREMKEETGLTIRNPQPCGFCFFAPATTCASTPPQRLKKFLQDLPALLFQ